ncbi:MAG: TATA-box-binding protein [Candidatus Baldrarchaeia archaeon]
MIELKPTYRVENIVASVVLDCRIDLERVASVLPNVEYDPEQFPGLVIRLQNPKAAVLVFNTGKMVVTGLKREEHAKIVVNKVIEKLRKAGIQIEGEPKIQIQNIVSSGSIGAEIDLEMAAMTLEDALYEPEQFPGLIYRMKDPNVVFLLFSSGKIVCTGAKREEDVKSAVEKLAKQLVELGLVGKPSSAET